MTTKAEAFKKTVMKTIPHIHVGDTLRVHQTIKEGGKERTQIFEGIVIARKHGNGPSGTITVRKVVQGVGVERIFPLHTPSVSNIEVMRSAKVRRSKLYYLRTAKGKKARLKKKEFATAIAEETSPSTPEVTDTIADTSAESTAQ